MKLAKTRRAAIHTLDGPLAFYMACNPLLDSFFLNSKEQRRFYHEIESVDGLNRALDRRFRDLLHRDDKRQAFVGKVRLLFQRLDVDAVLGNHLGHSGHNAGLIFHGETKIPSGRSRILGQSCLLAVGKARDPLGMELTSYEIVGDIDQVRDDRGPGGVSARTAAIEHLRPNHISAQKDGIVDVLYLGEHRTAFDEPRPHRKLKA